MATNILNKDGDIYPPMRVTVVQVYPFNDNKAPDFKNMLGLAHVVLNDQLMIRDLRIMDGVNGLFVAYPYRNPKFTGGDEYMSVANPITRELREEIENVVLEEYQRLTH